MISDLAISEIYRKKYSRYSLQRSIPELLSVTHKVTGTGSSAISKNTTAKKIKNMNTFIKTAVILTSLSAALMTSNAQAEILGVLGGQSANPEGQADLSVEIGYKFESDLSILGARVNYRLSPKTFIYGDLGFADFDFGSDGTPIGIGFRYHLADQRFVPSLDASVKGSFHIADFDSVDISELSVGLHVSGKEAIHESGLRWYGTASFSRVEVDFDIFGSDSDFEIGFGGGVYLPVKNGEAYVGLEHIDDLFIGIGYRYSIR